MHQHQTTASYEVTYRIVKFKKPYTIAEHLILPVAVDMVNIMAGESAVFKSAFVQYTISQRI
ncbi:hypothetical protein X975_21296, partial [Stegodyphus mimosarum]